MCRLDAAQVCTGCGRHIDEVIEWPSASSDRKHEIVARAKARLAQMKPGTPQ